MPPTSGSSRPDRRQSPGRPARQRRRLLGWVAAVAGLIVVLGTLVLARQRAQPVPNQAAGSSSVAKASKPTGAKVGQPIPPINATALEGRQVAVPTGKPSAVFFFAGWCGTCLPEAQALNRLQRELGAKVSVVAVDIDPSDDAQTIGGFLRAAGNPGYPVLHDRSGSLARDFDVTALDVTVVTDANGTVVYRDATPTPEGQLRAAFAQAGVE